MNLLFNYIDSILYNLSNKLDDNTFLQGEPKIQVLLIVQIFTPIIRTISICFTNQGKILKRFTVDLNT